MTSGPDMSSLERLLRDFDWLESFNAARQATSTSTFTPLVVNSLPAASRKRAAEPDGASAAKKRRVLDPANAIEQIEQQSRHTTLSPKPVPNLKRPAGVNALLVAKKLRFSPSTRTANGRQAPCVAVPEPPSTTPSQKRKADVDQTLSPKRLRRPTNPKHRGTLVSRLIQLAS